MSKLFSNYHSQNPKSTSNKGQVIIPANHPNPPESHELNAAHLLARHFQCTVEFLIPLDDYKRKTPDFKMLGAEWELKSPIGNSKDTIRNQMRLASKQSKYIVIDIRRSKIHPSKAERKIRNELSIRQATKRVLLIINANKIVDIL